MKTIDLEEIKNQVAEGLGYGKYWVSLSLDEKALLTDAVAEEYAKQCCEEQKIQCSNDVEIFNECDDPSYKTAEESILSTPNVAEKP